MAERLVKLLSESRNDRLADFALKGALVVGALGLGYVVVKAVSSPGAKGGSCTDPSTPCGSAISPYLQAYQSCASSYAYYQHQFDLQNATAKTGLTDEQLSTLDYYRNCMDQQASKIASVAKDYQPVGLTDDLAVLAEGLAIAAVVGVGLKTAPSIIRTLRTPPASGSGAAAKMTFATVQDEAASGTIGAADVGIFTKDLAARTTAFQLGDAALWNDLVARSVIDRFAAQSITEAVSRAMVDDLATTTRLLRLP